MPFNNFIEQLEEIPLDGNDLMIMSTKLGNSKTNWMQYQDLDKITNVSQLFSADVNTMYILLQIQGRDGGSIGHWVSLTKLNNVAGFDYSHYDSYGFSIDQETAITQERPLLRNLLRGVKVEENRVRHQAFKNKKNDVNTCGRHTVTRAIFYYLTNAQYNKLIIQPVINNNNVKDADVLVAVLTGFLPPDDEVVIEYFMNKANINSSSARGAIS